MFMKLTTGYEFQGYFITEYYDVIFDEILVGLGFGKSILSSLDNIFSSITGSEATEMIDRLNNVKKQLRDRVVQKAEKLGANALIGIDFESSRLGDLIMVSMTATAVRIEKIVSPLPYTELEQKEKEEQEKKEKLVEERQRRLEYLEMNGGKFDINHYIEGLMELETTKDVVESIERIAGERPDIADEDTLENIKKCKSLERLYGKGAGKQKAIDMLKEYCGL